ncbi:hypothetical protein B0A67_14190 [Flavobacterium aquidurense]|nr:hypothetical protein B0A67_14190 [Flavobacterium aquidurense]
MGKDGQFSSSNTSDCLFFYDLLRMILLIFMSIISNLKNKYSSIKITLKSLFSLFKEYYLYFLSEISLFYSLLFFLFPF